MPIYNLKCSTCGKRVKVQCPVQDRHRQECPDDSCKSNMEIVPSTTGFSLKGTGWYRDGY